MGALASKSQLRMSFVRWALVCVPLIMLLGFLSGRSVPSGDQNLWYQALEKPAVTRPRYSTWLVSSGRHPRPRSSIRRSARAATMHMLHVISRPESQKTAMMVMTTILSISSSLRGDCRFLCRVISTRAPSDTVTGGEGVRNHGRSFFFQFVSW